MSGAEIYRCLPSGANLRGPGGKRAGEFCEFHGRPVKVTEVY